LKNGGVSERSTIELRIIDIEGFQEGIQEGEGLHGVNDYLQIMKNVSSAFFKVLIDPSINNPLSLKKKNQFTKN